LVTGRFHFPSGLKSGIDAALCHRTKIDPRLSKSSIQDPASSIASSVPLIRIQTKKPPALRNSTGG
jgi:hypothetical protein